MVRCRLLRTFPALVPIAVVFFATIPLSKAFSTPIFGIGALFKPAGMKVTPSQGDDELLINAGKFFTEAFWSSKAGGASELSHFQSTTIEKQQVNEFRRRYGRYVGPRERRSELMLCTNGKGELMGCAGIEVDTIGKADGRGNRFSGPLMSNLAVGRKFRRRGLAEDLVQAAETMARKEWGFTECFLYVEKQNMPAVKLYKKLGYKILWEDSEAKTLIPLKSGKLSTKPTVILCMKKQLGGLSRWLPF